MDGVYVRASENSIVHVLGSTFHVASYDVGSDAFKSAGVVGVNEVARGVLWRWRPGGGLMRGG